MRHRIRALTSGILGLGFLLLSGCEVTNLQLQDFAVSTGIQVLAQAIMNYAAAFIAGL